MAKRISAAERKRLDIIKDKAMSELRRNGMDTALKYADKRKVELIFNEDKSAVVTCKDLRQAVISPFTGKKYYM